MFPLLFGVIICNTQLFFTLVLIYTIDSIFYFFFYIVEFSYLEQKKFTLFFKIKYITFVLLNEWLKEIEKNNKNIMQL